MHAFGPRPIRVRIAHPESILALGMAAVLREETAFDIATIACDDTAVSAACSGVVITDYRLGLRWAGRLRVLVVSSHDREHEVRQALERGVQGYVRATCRPAELVEAVFALSRGNRYLSLEAAARMASSIGREPLTSREHEVLVLLALGDCNKTIARRLDIAIGTVKAHVQSVLHKLGASSRTRAICIANERGLIESREAELHVPA